MTIQIPIDNPGIGEFSLASVTSETTTDPGAGAWQTNAAGTRIDLSNTAFNGLPVSGVIATLASGSHLQFRRYGEDRTWTVQNVVDRTTYRELTVTSPQDSTSFTLNIGDRHSVALIPSASAVAPEGTDIKSTGEAGALSLQSDGADGAVWATAGAPSSHAIGGPSHSTSTFADLKTKISGGETIVGSLDPALTDDRDPTAHTHLQAEVTDLDAYTQALVDSKDAATLVSAQGYTDTHEARTDDPHSVTKAQVGLANVDDTSDALKPLSDAAVTALAGKAASVHGHEGTEILSTAEGAGRVLTTDGANGSLWQDAGAPGAHATSHQDGNADEINVAGLSGVLADPQTPATHALAEHTGDASDIGGDTSATVTSKANAAQSAAESTAAVALVAHDAAATHVPWGSTGVETIHPDRYQGGSGFYADLATLNTDITPDHVGNVFVQSADPDTAAVDGDIWIEVLP